MAGRGFGQRGCCESSAGSRRECQRQGIGAWPDRADVCRGAESRCRVIKRAARPGRRSERRHLRPQAGTCPLRSGWQRSRGTPGRADGRGGAGAAERCAGASRHADAAAIVHVAGQRRAEFRPGCARARRGIQERRTSTRQAKRARAGDVAARPPRKVGAGCHGWHDGADLRGSRRPHGTRCSALVEAGADVNEVSARQIQPDGEGDHQRAPEIAKYLLTTAPIRIWPALRPDRSVRHHRRPVGAESVVPAAQHRPGKGRLSGPDEGAARPRRQC